MPPIRPVIGGAFGLLASLHKLGSARVSQLQRDCGPPRTTVYRLLTQLEVGAVERSAGRWRLGPTLVEFGAGVPAAPRLRTVARRPLLDLANATGALVALSVEMAGQIVVIDVVPGPSPLAIEPDPGMVIEVRSSRPCARTSRLAAVTCERSSRPARSIAGSAAWPPRCGSRRATSRWSGSWCPAGRASRRRWWPRRAAPPAASPPGCRGPAVLTAERSSEPTPPAG
jgi:hypothetical protein